VSAQRFRMWVRCRTTLRGSAQVGGSPSRGIDVACHDRHNNGSTNDDEALDETSDEAPWYAPGCAATLQGKGCAPRPREHVWMLTKAGRRMQASPLFQGESYGWETQLLEGGDVFYGPRFLLKAGAQAEAEAMRDWFVRDGWTDAMTSRPEDR